MSLSDATPSVGSKPTRSEVQRLINDVKLICPDLGDGFVHACLAVMGYDTQAVVNALLEGNPLPYPLHLLDRSLGHPGGKVRQDQRTQAAAPEEEDKDEEFLRLQKAYLRNLERSQVSGWGGRGDGRLCPTAMSRLTPG